MISKVYSEYKAKEPLTSEETTQLFMQMAGGSKEARDKLIIHNLCLVYYEVINKFGSYSCDKDDLISIGSIGLLKAIDSFDISKGFKFCTYACKCIDNEIFLFLRRNKKFYNNISFDDIILRTTSDNTLKIEDILSDDVDIAEDYVQKESLEIIKVLIESLPDNEKEIIKLYFGFYDNEIYNQREIAEKIHAAQSSISRKIARIIKTLQMQLDNTRLQRVESKYNETLSLKRNI